MVFYVVPFLGGIYFSMTDGTIMNRFVFLENYKRVWGNAGFLLGLKNSLVLSLICAPPSSSCLPSSSPSCCVPCGKNPWASAMCC